MLIPVFEERMKKQEEAKRVAKQEEAKRIAKQESVVDGVAEVPWGTEVEVVFETPFAVRPTLTFPAGRDTTCEVRDEQAASFKLKRGPSDNSAVSIAKVRWMAKGKRAT
jgi:hypothetical protein